MSHQIDHGCSDVKEINISCFPKNRILCCLIYQFSFIIYWSKLKVWTKTIILRKKNIQKIINFALMKIHLVLRYLYRIINTLVCVYNNKYINELKSSQHKSQHITASHHQTLDKHKRKSNETLMDILRKKKKTIICLNWWLLQ